MTDNEVVTLEAEIPPEDAARDIAKAVSARHAIARRYVLWLRRRNPEATPAEIVRMLERHYGASITSAGALISAGVIAADIGIALIPVGGAVAAGTKSASEQAAKKTGKEAVKLAAKGMALSAASSGARRAATFIPAGDKQLQFEITAIFALAVADIHSMSLDKDQSFALVYGLTNERVSQEQITIMATDVAKNRDDAVAVGQKFAEGRGDWSHWANTLADTLPAGAAQSLVKTIETGHLDTLRDHLGTKQQTAIEYGVGAITGGVARFVFGRDVVLSSRTAFASPPELFPEHLQTVMKSTSGEDDVEGDASGALGALVSAAKGTGSRIADTAAAVGGSVATGAGAVGSGVANATGAATRVFRSVDLDGDGIPDEPQALTAVKAAGGAVAGAAGAVGGGVAGLFSRKKKVEE